VTLVLQTLLPVLARADGASTVAGRGGTHMAWSPPFDYVRDVWLPALGRLGVTASVELRRSGWYPVGRGEVRATVAGGGPPARSAVTLLDRGALKRVHGRALAANLPAHIPRRMADRARSLLADAGVDARIDADGVRAACPGTGLFLCVEYEACRAGFSALGEIGKRAETVAEEAVTALLAHRDAGACLDTHLADQLLVPLALAGGTSAFSVERVTPHLATNAWLVERFGLARIRIEARDDGTGLVTVEGRDRASG
jgi:RNA 3'-terminal phosphate cyclase (ATP)